MDIDFRLLRRWFEFELKRFTPPHITTIDCFCLSLSLSLVDHDILTVFSSIRKRRAAAHLSDGTDKTDLTWTKLNLTIHCRLHILLWILLPLHNWRKWQKTHVNATDGVLLKHNANFIIVRQLIRTQMSFSSLIRWSAGETE